MNWFDKLLQSRIARGGALIVGLLAGLTTIFARIFPDPLLTRQLAIVCLGIVVFYFVAVGVMTRRKVSEAERVYKYLSRRYGIGYGDLDVSCIIHPDGSATIQRIVAVESYSLIKSLETSLLMPEPPPLGEKREVVSVDIEPVAPPPYVSLVRTVPLEKKLFAEIAFSPELHEGTAAGFKMTEKLSPGLFAVGLSEKDLRKRCNPDKDYFGWNIDRPTRTLRLKVFFPEGVKPRVFGSEVRYAIAFSDTETARFQYEEQKRLQGPFLTGPERLSYILKLDVEYPMIGMIYILYWQPIPKREEIGIYQPSTGMPKEGLRPPDAYAHYEIGLQELLSRIRQDHPRYREVLVYQQRLIEKIVQSRLYGDTETLKAERAQVLDQLNELAQSVLGRPFYELCE